ncbi:unnamed protein product [Chrysoparadoxa australica]
MDELGSTPGCPRASPGVAWFPSGFHDRETRAAKTKMGSWTEETSSPLRFLCEAAQLAPIQETEGNNQNGPNQ